MTGNEVLNKLEAELTTPNQFTQWLNCYEDFAEIGLLGSNESCPIAQFLMHKGHKDPNVGTYKIVADRCRIPTPEWAKNFILIVDDMENAEREDLTPVTKKMAVQALTKALAWE